MVVEASHLFGSCCHGEMRSRRLNQSLGRLPGEAMTPGERASTDRLSCSWSDRIGSAAALVPEGIEAERQQAVGDRDMGDLVPV